MTTHLLVRVEVGDFDTWLRTHLRNTENRASFGLLDGPIYRDIDDPNAVLVHSYTDDMPRAMKWFETDAFTDASKQSTALRRDFYLAEEREPRP
jgi:hypothetical protein